MSSASSVSRALSSPSSQPSQPIDENSPEPVPLDLVPLYCQGDEKLKSYSVPTEPVCKGFLYCRAVKISGLRPFERIGVRFQSQNCSKDVSFSFMADYTGTVQGMQKECAMAFFDFQGNSIVKAFLFSPANFMNDEKIMGETSFVLRESSLVRHILHENGPNNPLPDFLENYDPDAEILVSKQAPRALPTVSLSFDAANIQIECEVASIVEGSTRLHSGELLLKRAVQENRFVLVQLLLKLEAGRQLSLWSRFDILDVTTDVSIAELLVNKADFFPKHRHCRQAIITGNAELLHFYLYVFTLSHKKYCVLTVGIGF